MTKHPKAGWPQRGTKNHEKVSGCSIHFCDFLCLFVANPFRHSCLVIPPRLAATITLGRMGIGRDMAYGIGAAVTSPLWGAALLRTGKWRTDWAGRFGRVERQSAGAQKQEKTEGAGRKRLLIHGVSVGEVNAVRKLVEDFEAAGDVELVISATTNTGFARAQALYGGKHRVVRFPLDFSFAVGRFLDAVRPHAVALVELEVWPNFMEACGTRQIPVVVVNGRLTERSYRGYRRIKRLIAPAFRGLAAAGVQTADYAERFVGLGLPGERVRVLDTMKWDTAEVADTVDGADRLAAEMGIDRSRPLVVAGSTSPGEERLLIESCPADAQLLIAPRKPEWFEGVMRAAPGAVRRTGPRNPDGTGGPRSASVGFDRVFLLDTIGELKKAYALADVCVVGRSFMGDLYGSDMMEPVALGKPTVIGPHYADFAETMAALLEAGGIVVSREPGGLGGVLDELLRNKAVAEEVAAAGRDVILSRQGATRRYAAMVRGVMGLEAAFETWRSRS